MLKSTEGHRLATVNAFTIQDITSGCQSQRKCRESCKDFHDSRIMMQPAWQHDRSSLSNSNMTKTRARKFRHSPPMEGECKRTAESENRGRRPNKRMEDASCSALDECIYTSVYAPRRGRPPLQNHRRYVAGLRAKTCAQIAIYGQTMRP